MRPGRTVRVEAPAKVNLWLHVLGRREDGFHDIETLFQSIELSDLVEVALVEPAVGSEARVRLEVRGADLGPVEENLAWRAASVLLGAADADPTVHIRLVKRIPAGAGLGGGSSDAAAVLRALDRLLDHPVDRETLERLAAELGSDVPFFLCGSPLAVGRGRGERLEPLPSLPVADLVVVMPPVHVATGGAYRALSRWRSERGEDAARRPRPGGAPRDWPAVTEQAWNDFEKVVSTSYPEVGVSLEALRDVGAKPALLSGSGGACFGVFRDRASAEEAVRHLVERLGWPAVVARTLERVPEITEVAAP